MKVPQGLMPSVAAELNALNDEQREAALDLRDLVVLAGPGSGKTRTLVAKGAYLLDSQIGARRGLAAITYTRYAAQEIQDRLSRLGLGIDRRLSAGTLHSWCLNAILRPYGPLLGIPIPTSGSVIDDKSDDWLQILQECLDEAGADANAKWERQRIIKIRRRLAAGLPEDPKDPWVQAAALLDTKIASRNLFDFDLMISQALTILRQSDRVSRMVAARYPWILVDEYQDLGPVLHALVGHLHDSAGVKVAAFGDPDQTIMWFAGADPTYLYELADRADFHTVPLKINYRSGKAIITASHTTIDVQRDHQPDPKRTDPGVIEALFINGGQARHASTVIAKLDELAAQDVPAHHIAIFYPRKGPLLDSLTAALDASNFDYVHEGDERLPTGDIVDFVRSCAARAVAGPQPIGYGLVDYGSAVSTIHDLARAYIQLVDNSQIARPNRRALERTLAMLLHRVETEDDFASWLIILAENLQLAKIAERSPQKRDHVALDGLIAAAQLHGLTIGEVAGTLRVGRITLTTYHSAKGREWDYVIMPGLIDSIMPLRRWSKTNQRYMEASADQFEHDRRAFYVGLTRAKRAAILTYGTYWETKWGARNTYGVCPYVTAVLAKLAEMED